MIGGKNRINFVNTVSGYVEIQVLTQHKKTFRVRIPPDAFGGKTECMGALLSRVAEKIYFQINPHNSVFSINVPTDPSTVIPIMVPPYDKEDDFDKVIIANATTAEVIRDDSIPKEQSPVPCHIGKKRKALEDARNPEPKRHKTYARKSKGNVVLTTDCHAPQINASYKPQFVKRNKGRKRMTPMAKQTAGVIALLKEKSVALLVRVLDRILSEASNKPPVTRTIQRLLAECLQEELFDNERLLMQSNKVRNIVDKVRQTVLKEYDIKFRFFCAMTRKIHESNKAYYRILQEHLPALVKEKEAAMEILNDQTDAKESNESNDMNFEKYTVECLSTPSNSLEADEIHLFVLHAHQFTAGPAAHLKAEVFSKTFHTKNAKALSFGLETCLSSHEIVELGPTEVIKVKEYENNTFENPRCSSAEVLYLELCRRKEETSDASNDEDN